MSDKRTGFPLGFFTNPGLLDDWTYRTYTAGQSLAAMQSEVGVLHMQVKEAERTAERARAMLTWIAAQPIILTESLLCTGAELEQRIRDEAARAEICQRSETK